MSSSMRGIEIAPKTMEQVSLVEGFNKSSFFRKNNLILGPVSGSYYLYWRKAYFMLL